MDAKAGARVAAAQTSLDLVVAKVGKLRAELAKAETQRDAAEKELQDAQAAQEAAAVAAEEKARMAKRWHPPCDAASRGRALGEEGTALSACWEFSAPLPLPQPDDWLAKGQPGEADRSGQTVAQFCRPGRSVPSPIQRTIYIVPIGRAAGSPPATTLVEFLSASFGLEVKSLPASAVTQKEALARVQGSNGQSLLAANDALDALYRHKPKDAFLLIGCVRS